jgi:hypothetical protein
VKAPRCACARSRRSSRTLSSPSSAPNSYAADKTLRAEHARTNFTWSYARLDMSDT